MIKLNFDEKEKSLEIFETNYQKWTATGPFVRSASAKPVNYMNH